MKIDIKSSGKRYTVDFNIGINPDDSHFTAMAKSSKELDKLREAISNKGADEDMISSIIAKAMENKLKLPIKPDYDYNGAGYAFSFDLYAIAKMLK